MLKFKFKLEAVLKHRAVLEEQALQAFAVVQNELSACVAREAALQMEFRSVAQSRPAGFEAEKLRLRERHLDGLREQIERQERMREGLTARLEDARTRLVQCRQERQMLEKLRAKALLDHRREEGRAEQQAIDEMAVLRHPRMLASGEGST